MPDIKTLEELRGIIIKFFDIARAEGMIHSKDGKHSTSSESEADDVIHYMSSWLTSGEGMTEEMIMRIIVDWEQLPDYEHTHFNLAQAVASAARRIERDSASRPVLDEGKTIKEIAKVFFEDIRGVEWGHSGTIDDESWRREEKHYLLLAKDALKPILSSARSEEQVREETVQEILDRLDENLFYDRSAGDVEISFTIAGWEELRKKYSVNP